MIRVVVAEDQNLVLAALAALLELESDIRVVGRANDGTRALTLVSDLRPDVLVTDIEMPDMSGLDVAAEIQRRALPTRTILVTTFARGGYLRRALEANVLGYLLKDAPASALVDAVRRVHQGLRVIDPELAREAWSDRDPLSDRERRVLRLAADGASTSTIAATLGLSAGTVRNYLSDAILKIGAANRVEAARIAQQKGWL